MKLESVMQQLGFAALVIIGSTMFLFPSIALCAIAGGFSVWCAQAGLKRFRIYLSNRVVKESTPGNNGQNFSIMNFPTLRKLKLNHLAWFVAAIFIIGWFIYVWPSPYRYYKSGSEHFRVNRFTGKTQTLDYGGWHP